MADEAIPEAEPQPEYPDTAVGTLMRQRDDRQRAAKVARSMADLYLQQAVDAEAQVDQLTAAIDAMNAAS